MQEFSCGAVSQGSSIVNAVAKVGSLAQKLLHAAGEARRKKKKKSNWQVYVCERCRGHTSLNGEVTHQREWEGDGRVVTSLPPLARSVRPKATLCETPHTKENTRQRGNYGHAHDALQLLPPTWESRVPRRSTWAAAQRWTHKAAGSAKPTEHSIFRRQRHRSSSSEI